MASTLELVFQAATALGTLVTAGSIYILKRTLDAQRHTLESQDTSLQAQLKALDTEYAWRRMNVAIDPVSYTHLDVYKRQPIWLIIIDSRPHRRLSKARLN